MSFALLMLRIMLGSFRPVVNLFSSKLRVSLYDVFNVDLKGSLSKMMKFGKSS